MDETEKVKQFLEANRDLQNFVGEDFGLSARDANIVVVDNNGYLQVMIAVGEQTKHETLEKAIPLALQWRERLLKYQGFGTYNERFLEKLGRRSERGESYQKLADWINCEVADHLKVAFKHWQKANTIMVGWEHWQQRILSESAMATEIAIIRQLLKAIRLEDHKIESLWQEGLDRIANGLPPLEVSKNYPVTRRKVIDTLKTWRGRKINKEQKAVKLKKRTA